MAWICKRPSHSSVHQVEGGRVRGREGGRVGERARERNLPIIIKASSVDMEAIPRETTASTTGPDRADGRLALQLCRLPVPYHRPLCHLRVIARLSHSQCEPLPTTERAQCLECEPMPTVRALAHTESSPVRALAHNRACPQACAYNRTLAPWRQFESLAT